MDQASNPTFSQKLSYYRWPIGIVIFFVALAAFNVHLLRLAFLNHPAAIHDSPYEAGLVYEQTISNLRQARELILSHTLSVTQDGKTRATVELVPVKGQSIDCNEMRLNLMHPVTKKKDLIIKLNLDSTRANFFSGRSDTPINGSYLYELESIGRAKPFLIKGVVEVNK